MAQTASAYELLEQLLEAISDHTCDCETGCHIELSQKMNEAQVWLIQNEPKKPDLASRNDMRWGVHCDTEVWFFETEEDAISKAEQQINLAREESKRDGVWDGWDCEELVERICVFKVVLSAQKANPEAHYSNIDYQLFQVD